ncbi:MAG: PAS domain-containing protein, partial [Bacteroidales bacterium]|nr:PAS domain-containing protein [Bacteroidales bacterium]
MKREYSKPFVLKYTAIAFVSGMLFVLIALFTGAMLEGQSFGRKYLIEQHIASPMMYLFDMLPIMLALVTYFVARSISIRNTMVDKRTHGDQLHQHRLYRFVEDLIAGKTDTEFEGEELDALDRALVGLRDYIASSKRDEAQRRQDDELRRWSTEGLAKFGEILRYNNDNIEELSYQVVLNLVKYVGANQGGFYLLDTSDKSNVHFRMTACYAYERRKYADRVIAWGDGLVGACALERQMIHLKKVPDSFLKITSGLGQANPRNVILMPLKFNDTVHGVIELASFNPFEPHHIEFIEKVTESIATTISTVKNNIVTSTLLLESRKQAEELAMKEEQMRQNMEELQAAQEELNRQSEKFVSFSNSVNHTMVRAEIDVNGILIYANTKFLQKFEYSSNSEVEGKPITMFVNKKDRDWFDDIWLGLSRGGKHFEGDMKMQSRTGKELWMMATYTCVRNAEGGVDNILFLGIDTTEKKQQSLYYEGQIHALDRSSLKLELYPTADIVAANSNFLNLMGYSDLRNQTLFDLIAGTDRANIDKIWDDIIHGIQYEGQLRFISRSNEEKWLLCTFSAV